MENMLERVDNNRFRILREKMEEITMIDTEIFTYESCNNYICFEEVLKMVNELITEKGIKKVI